MIIYKVINLINGKIYIGQTLNNNKYYFGSGIKLKDAIKKYGKINFKRVILCFCNTKKELNAKETYWIKKLNSTNKKIGYNLTFGGEGGFKHSEETKKIIIEKNKSWHKLNDNPFKGKKHSIEIRKYLSNKHKGKILSEEQKEKIGRYARGKTYNELYGKEKATILKNKRIESNKKRVYSEKTKLKIKNKQKNHQDKIFFNKIKETENFIVEKRKENYSIRNISRIFKITERVVNFVVKNYENRKSII